MFGEAVLLEAVPASDFEAHRPLWPGEEYALQIGHAGQPASESGNRTPLALPPDGGYHSGPGAALGWAMEILCLPDVYERHPFARYRMACYIHAQDRIGEVTRRSIEPISPPLYTRSGFCNPHVDQAWVRCETSLRVSDDH